MREFHKLIPQMDIDLFLFGQAFQETWKLQKGMVIVLLNPQIYKQKHRNSFSLRMTSNKTPLSMDHQQQQASDLEGGESVLEVGFSRDWAGCEALKADGAVCGDWVDTRHARVCAWHVDQGMKRARKGRMEYAVGYIPFPPESLLTIFTCIEPYLEFPWIYNLDPSCSFPSHTISSLSLFPVFSLFCISDRPLTTIVSAPSPPPAKKKNATPSPPKNSTPPPKTLPNGPPSQTNGTAAAARSTTPPRPSPAQSTPLTQNCRN